MKVLRRLALGARRLSRSWTAMVTLLLVVGLVVVAYRAGTRSAPVDDTVSNVPRVGPADGQPVDAYRAAASHELDGSRNQPTWALVSLTGYQRPAALASLLTGVDVSRVVARVPLPDVQTQLVTLVVDRLTVDVPTGMRRTATAKERAATTAASSAASAGTSELKQVYAQEAAVQRREAAAYRSLCACVYGAVVRGTPAQLRTLAQRPGIRVVDPAPEVTRLDRATFVPLLPEQSGTVGPPSDTAAGPSATPSRSAVGHN
ncbi:hypothetical protein [Cryptosporangium phraense]|uniref:Uncharacterized protein n=1 Tax=Cryptosporangium phraense TaxID=2593070 RepID=A0A545AK26_9ACTN|nr:hypothetical protein [Cryptosporangium phraense]TQS41686.1 hypothetical protein FL583_27995 [Cryptosporangium phraense]